MISERTLRKWRREALRETRKIPTTISQEWRKRILRMTQELLDQHLLTQQPNPTAATRKEDIK